jgi:hypothetical protein
LLPEPRHGQRVGHDVCCNPRLEQSAGKLLSTVVIFWQIGEVLLGEAVAPLTRGGVHIKLIAEYQTFGDIKRRPQLSKFDGRLYRLLMPGLWQ